MTKKPITTKWFERDDGLTDDQRKERIETMRRKVVMPKKKKPGAKKSVDLPKLTTLLEEGGHNAEELMGELGGVSKLALRNAILKVTMNTEKVFRVDGLYGKGAGNIKLGKLGIRIPVKRLTKTFKEGDEFSFKVEENRIVLSKV
jgi:hypothetical protein